MQLSPPAAPSTAPTSFISRQFVDSDPAGTPSGWQLTGITHELGAATAYTKSLGAGGRVQIWRMDAQDPRIAGAAALLTSRIDGLGDLGPAEQAGVPSYSIGVTTVDADGKLHVRSGFPTVASAPNSVLDVRAAAQALRALLIQHGQLDRPGA